MAGTTGFTGRLTAPIKRALLASAVLALLGAQAHGAPPRAAPAPSTGFVALVNRVSPAVVNIDVEQRVRRRIPDWFGTGEGTTTQVRRGVGSGFVIAADGLVVTNNHVVQGQSKLVVTLWDGRTLPGRVLGSDPLTDLALVKIEGRGLPFLVLGNSDRAQVGEWVIALGSPLGLRRTVTAGIVSSTNREVSINERLGFIQTDAAINPGNSGGPLVNMAGQVIGINAVIAADAQGIGFAIPVNALKLVLDDLRTKGRVERAWLGISFAGITPELVEQFPELKGQEGLVVARVTAGSPAQRAGLRPEDVIVAFEGKRVTAARDLIAAMARRRPGDRVTLSVQRGKRRLEVAMTLGTMPESAAQPVTPEEP
ncbi:MAG TPA: trypsin-like peptidase domain-containing protein [Pantanalinema sp.]